jgi:hypothetical protein
MGAEAIVTARFKGKDRHRQGAAGNGRAAVPRRRCEAVDSVRADVEDRRRAGTLSVTFPDGTASFDLGVAAPKWAEKMQHPPSRLQKIGVKPEWRVSAIGVTDAAFLHELEDAVAHLSIGRVVKDCDAIFFGVTKEAELTRLETLKASLKPNGALWIVRPKGRPEISERANDGGRQSGGARGREGRQLFADTHRGEVRHSGRSTATMISLRARAPHEAARAGRRSAPRRPGEAHER